MAPGGRSTTAFRLRERRANLGLWPHPLRVSRETCAVRGPRSIGGDVTGSQRLFPALLHVKQASLAKQSHPAGQPASQPTAIDAVVVSARTMAWHSSRLSICGAILLTLPKRARGWSGRGCGWALELSRGAAGALIGRVRQAQGQTRGWMRASSSRPNARAKDESSSSSSRSCARPYTPPVDTACRSHSLNNWSVAPTHL